MDEARDGRDSAAPALLCAGAARRLRLAYQLHVEVVHDVARRDGPDGEVHRDGHDAVRRRGRAKSCVRG